MNCSYTTPLENEVDRKGVGTKKKMSKDSGVVVLSPFSEVTNKWLPAKALVPMSLLCLVRTRKLSYQAPILLILHISPPPPPGGGGAVSERWED